MQILVANTKGGCGKSTIVASLADVLDADIIDHDNQGTIRICASLTKRRKPISYDDISNSKNIVIHDTPPYNASNLKGLMESSSLIIIPCKLVYPDLVALNALANEIQKLNVTLKSIIVFNEVRKPYDKISKELKTLYDKVYPDIKKAKVHLSNLVGFKNVFKEHINGKALQQIQDLVYELGIKKLDTHGNKGA